MGTSVSCLLCLDIHGSTRREVLVLKEDGEVIKFTEGTRVKDILAACACPHHKIIPCTSTSDRSFLPNSCRLNSDQLYFLLPKGLAVCDDAGSKEFDVLKGGFLSK